MPHSVPGYHRRDSADRRQSPNELQTLLHGLGHLPGHLRSPAKARLCYPCLRNELSPFSQEGQRSAAREIL